MFTVSLFALTSFTGSLPRAVCVDCESLSRVQLVATPWIVTLPRSSVHRILQARILEWVAILFSRGSSQPRDRTQVTCIAGRFFIIWATREAQCNSCTCVFQIQISFFFIFLLLYLTSMSDKLFSPNLTCTYYSVSFEWLIGPWLFGLFCVDCVENMAATSAKEPASELAVCMLSHFSCVQLSRPYGL